jgi:triacylglycerol esterase/lipase EstA (alpha/beta hydrolase family)
LARPIVILVPGFLGFQKLGNMPYFPGVEEALRVGLRRAKFDADVASIATLPTSSLRLRAARLCEAVNGMVDGEREIHLIGHSTGGLDCRLFTTAGANLPTDTEVEPLAARVKSIVTVSTPHFGTPLAAFFAGVQGHRALGLLSLFMTRLLRFGRHPLRGVVAVGRAVVLLDRLTGLDATLLGHLQQQVLDGLPHEHRVELEKLLGDVGEDQRLIEQLTPPSIELFNAGANDREGVRYGCVVVRGPKPRKRDVIRPGRDLYAWLSRALYFSMHRLTSSSGGESLSMLDGRQIQSLVRAFGHVPGPGDNDGIVPTLSQVHGDVVASADADHLDVMGYFRDDHGPGVDWLASGSPFDRPAFERLWHRVGEFVAEGCDR